MAERLGNRASHLKVASSILGRAQKMTLCPWARHFTLLPLGALYLL